MKETSSDFVAIIPARGGSKGLQRKNLLPLVGRPLICHTIEAALGCLPAENVFVSTEDPEIASVAKSAGAEVISRPLALAGDDATSEDVVLHALGFFHNTGRRFESFALLQPTSPLRTSGHLSACIAAFRSGEYGCAISVCEAEHHPAKMMVMEPGGTVLPLGQAGDLSKARQQLRKAYRQNGAIYLMRSSDFQIRAKGFFLEPALGFVMSQEASVDIDSAHDLRIAELLLETRA